MAGRWNVRQRSAKGRVRNENACVSGLVSRGGGEDAVEERFPPEERTLREPEQHGSEQQQLCAGQREVWYTLTNATPTRLTLEFTTRLGRKTMYVFTVYLMCVLAPEQPGRQLHGGAEFRGSGQGQRGPQPQPQPRPHLQHAGV